MPNMMGDFCGPAAMRSWVLGPSLDYAVADPLATGGVFPSQVPPEGVYVVSTVIPGTLPPVDGTTFVYDNFDAFRVDREQGSIGENIPLSVTPGYESIYNQPPYAASHTGVVTNTGQDLLELRRLFVLALPSPAAGVIGRGGKISENDSILPQNRVFFDYSFFHNALISPCGAEVHRFMPGAEKTFLNDQMSLQVRVPMGVSLDNYVSAEGQPTPYSTEFGNIAFTLKGVLRRWQHAMLGAGMALTIPTADDIYAVMQDGTPVARIANDSVHLMPYVGMYCEPNDRWYAMGILQFDVDANGNRVYVNSAGQGLNQAGTLSDQTFLYASASVGRWIYRNTQPSRRRLKGIVLTAEGHYTGTLNSADSVTQDLFCIGDPTYRLHVFDLTLGTHVFWGKTNVGIGYCTPLTDDRVFDGELRLLANRYF
ncbi:MAG: hypothetical protein ACOY3P_10480 [Planctomycetota bacterium]